MKKLMFKGVYTKVIEYNLEEGLFYLDILSLRHESLGYNFSYPVWAYPFLIPVHNIYNLPELKFSPKGVGYHLTIKGINIYLSPEDDFSKTGRCRASEAYDDWYDPRNIYEYFVDPLISYQENKLQAWVNTIHSVDVFELYLVSEFIEEKISTWLQVDKDDDFSTYLSSYLVEDPKGNLFLLPKLIFK